MKGAGGWWGACRPHVSSVLALAAVSPVKLGKGKGKEVSPTEVIQEKTWCARQWLSQRGN